MAEHWRTSRATPGGVRQLPGSPHRAASPREYVNRYFPPGSILAEPTSPSLERPNILQALLDVLALLGAFLLVSATGCGIAFAFFVLFFVRL